MNATCNTCNGGTMVPSKVNRMSPPVVIIGWILLVPSIILVLMFGGCAVISGIGGAGAAASDPGDMKAEQLGKAQEILVNAGFTAEDSQRILDEETITSTAMNQEYTDTQRDAVSEAMGMRMAAEMLGNSAAVVGGIGAILGVIGAIISFVGGLIGWLLIMKKKVLKCSSCSATVDAA